VLKRTGPVEVGDVPDVVKGKVLVDSRGTGSFQGGSLPYCPDKAHSNCPDYTAILIPSRLGLNPQQIYDGGKLPGRTYRSIVKQISGSIVYTKQSAIVRTIEPANITTA